MTFSPTPERTGGTRRGAQLRIVRRRFTRRWVSGIVAGLVISVGNSFAYRWALERAAAAADLPEALSQIDVLILVNTALAVGTLAALAAIALLFFRPLDRDLRAELRLIGRAEEEQEEESARRRFDAEVAQGLEMAADEDSVARLIAAALAQGAPGQPAELLLADASDAHLATCATNPAGGPAGCGVAEPFACPAVRKATTLVFPSSSAVNACPYLRDRPGDSRSAVCVPLAFMGRSMGVLHLTSEEDTIPDAGVVTRMTSLANQVGSHLGSMRAFDSARLQANTDALTGLANRRSLEDRLSRRLAQGEHFAVAMADLDGFKQVNDTHGHEAGDRALRMFSEVVRQTLRSEDLIARWGGEEFLIAFPRMTAVEAVDALDRVRLALAEAAAKAETVPVTASFGVVDTSVERSLPALVRAADAGLSAAKEAGKDRVVIGPDPSRPDVHTMVGSTALTPY